MREFQGTQFRTNSNPAILNPSSHIANFTAPRAPIPSTRPDPPAFPFHSSRIPRNLLLPPSVCLPAPIPGPITKDNTISHHRPTRSGPDDYPRTRINRRQNNPLPTCALAIPLISAASANAAVAYATGNSEFLYRFDPASPQSVPSIHLSPGIPGSAAGLEFDAAGQFWALFSNRLYRIDLAANRVVLSGSLILPPNIVGPIGGLSLNPITGQMEALVDSQSTGDMRLLQININTLATQSLGIITHSGSIVPVTNLTGLAHDSLGGRHIIGPDTVYELAGPNGLQLTPRPNRMGGPTAYRGGGIDRSDHDTMYAFRYLTNMSISRIDSAGQAADIGSLSASTLGVLDIAIIPVPSSAAILGLAAAMAMRRKRSA